MLQRYGYGSGRIPEKDHRCHLSSGECGLLFFFPVLERVDVETVDILGRMVEDVVGAAVC
jgi:hypothetical protein